MIAAFWLPSPILAADYGDLTVEGVRSVYDGDTFRVDIAGLHPLMGQNIPVRLRGVDAPEIRGKCEAEKSLAIKARDYVRALLGGAKEIILQNIDRGKYFRIVADVSVDGLDLGETLIEVKLGRPYDGGKKGSWCSP